jgi:hypothetical protein
MAAAARGSAVEFSELLDAITTVPVAATSHHLPADPAIDVPIEPHVTVESLVVEEPPQTSRFADAGIDDDRLPLHASAKRNRRR